MHAVPHDDQLPLDGRWRFQLLHRPDEAPGEAWGEADVPGCLTMKDTAAPEIYTNVQMPFPNRARDLEENPTGVYERSFEVPPLGGRVCPAGARASCSSSSTAPTSGSARTRISPRSSTSRPWCGRAATTCGSPS
jgi:hypothetical protein